ncbi:MAG TPA: hypothetical protein VLD67_14980, partial [Vicinamibacterales bacterium]|nr:hypothetical protein [Vicinamibacterales bacterium]
PDAASTRWGDILGLYDDLIALNPSPVIALNRAVALARVRGAADGLQAVEALEADPTLADYYLLPSVKACLLVELGERDAAAAAYREALARPCSEPERRFLTRRLRDCRA